jgi:hypothetical protein
MKTLSLDAVSWDLVKDVSGNIALASEPYSLAQDAASAIKLFARELWYNTSKGVPYFEQTLGKAPNISLIKAKFTDAAKTVPGVISAKVFISSIQNRAVSGQVQVTDANGNTRVATFVATPPGN